MIVRPAATADIPAMAAVLEANGETDSWPDVPGRPYLEHLVGRASARALVGEVDGVVVGWGATIEVGGPRRRFITDLFIDPAHQSRGVGRAILADLVDGATERLTLSSGDPRALAAYVRAGMRPWWPVLYLTVPGEAVHGVAGAVPGERDGATATAERAGPAETAHWSQAWTGMDRRADFDYDARLPDAAGWLIRERGEPAAIAWSRRRRDGSGRTLVHATIAPAVDPVAATLAALAAAAGGAESVSCTIPGPHPAVPWLLERGARIVDRDTYCATDRDLLDPERILPDPGFL
jgi:GNAT superfamily N-acetyltransferase